MHKACIVGSSRAWGGGREAHQRKERMILHAPAHTPSWAQERLPYCTVLYCLLGWPPSACERGGVEWVVAERGREGGRSGEGGPNRSDTPTHPSTSSTCHSLPVQPTHAPTHTPITPCAPWLRQSFSCVSHLLYMYVPPTSLLFVLGSPMLAKILVSSSL
jgi:hypothetical protein